MNVTPLRENHEYYDDSIGKSSRNRIESVSSVSETEISEKDQISLYHTDPSIKQHSINLTEKHIHIWSKFFENVSLMNPVASPMSDSDALSRWSRHHPYETQNPVLRQDIPSSSSSRTPRSIWPAPINDSDYDELIHDFLSNPSHIFDIQWLTAVSISAAKRGDTLCLENLLLGPSSDDVVSCRDEYARSAVHYVAKLDHLECLGLLYDYGFDLEAVDQDGRTPLHVCAVFGSYACMQFLLQSAVDVNKCDHNMNSALHLASRNGFYRCCVLLLQYDADASSLNDSQQTALDFAYAIRPRTEVVDELIRLLDSASLKRLNRSRFINVNTKSARAYDPRVEIASTSSEETIRSRRLDMYNGSIHNSGNQRRTDSLVNKKDNQYSDDESWSNTRSGEQHPHRQLTNKEIRRQAIKRRMLMEETEDYESVISKPWMTWQINEGRRKKSENPLLDAAYVDTSSTVQWNRPKPWDGLTIHTGRKINNLSERAPLHYVDQSQLIRTTMEPLRVDSADEVDIHREQSALSEQIEEEALADSSLDSDDIENVNEGLLGILSNRVWGVASTLLNVTLSMFSNEDKSANIPRISQEVNEYDEKKIHDTSEWSHRPPTDEELKSLGLGVQAKPPSFIAEDIRLGIEAIRSGRSPRRILKPPREIQNKVDAMRYEADRILKSHSQDPQSKITNQALQQNPFLLTPRRSTNEVTANERNDAVFNSQDGHSRSGQYESNAYSLGNRIPEGVSWRYVDVFKEGKLHM